MKVEVRRSRDDKKPLEVEYDFGKNTAEAIERFNTAGPYGDVVHGLFVQAAKMQLRNFVVESKLTGAALNAKLATWKPELLMRGKPPLEKARKLVRTMSVEERDALLKELQGGNGAA